MAKRRNVVAEELRILAQNLKELLGALTTDPKQQAQKQRLWRILYALSGAIFTLAARRVAARAWAILTGEQPPTARPSKAQAKTTAPTYESTASPGPTTPDAASAERGAGEPSDPEAAGAPATTASRDV